MDKIKVFICANHLVVDSYRKKKSESLDSLLENGFDPTHDEKPIQDMRDDTETANALLNTLEGKHKEVIVLRYIEELSVKEIAKIMNESENTTSVRIHRALEKLKQASTQYE
jgi:RNA polymerase sigma-70 factor (ECF subfamily)